MDTVAVLGAGPKGVAIAAKAWALAAAGLPAPEVVLVDEREVAAHWTGQAGYTDGAQRLGTPPEKDLGFPYAASWGPRSADVCAAMRDVSWAAFLQSRGAYADWVDRGRLRPRHREWGAYLRWACARVGARVREGQVASVDVVGERWRLAGPRGDALSEADGLVVTGPGPARRVTGQDAAGERVLDGRTVWPALERLAAAPRPLEVCVAGTGETAGSAAAALLDRLPAGSTVELVSDLGVLYTRGEGWSENRLYSEPEPDWARMAERHRRELLRRTDRGVVSVAGERLLAEEGRLRVAAGRLERVEVAGAKVVAELAYDGAVERVAFDEVVVAIGFDTLWWRGLLGPGARAALAAYAAPAADGDGAAELDASAVEHGVERDLALAGVAPRLHLPLLAGLRQGPGFPNLSCLGLLADRVLGGVEHPRGLPVLADRASG